MVGWAVHQHAEKVVALFAAHIDFVAGKVLALIPLCCDEDISSFVVPNSLVLRIACFGGLKGKDCHGWSQRLFPVKQTP